LVGEIWDLIILSPVINVLIVISGSLFHNFGLAIIALTIIVNVITLPLTLKQIRAMKAMQELQPKIAELQKKHGKDRMKMAQEQQQLFKESGVSPAGCMVPMLIQFPIWIALFQSIIRVLAVTPEGFLNLARHLYSSWAQVFSLVPLNSKFLVLDLAAPNFVIAILVGGTMWLQQKMTMPSTADSRQQAQSTMMLWMMPLMFAFITMQVPSGLALYWVTSSVIRIVMQYYMTGGWGGLTSGAARKPAGKDKRYITRITRVEEKPADYDDVGADISVEAAEQGAAQKMPKSLRMIQRHPKKGKSHRPKRR